MSSQLGYKGKVTIKVKNKPPVIIKNTGTVALFDVLSKALCLFRNFSEEYCAALRTSVPSQAMLLCYVDSNDVPGDIEAASNYQTNWLSGKSSVQKLLNPIPIVRSSVKTDKKLPVVEYAFYLTESNLWNFTETESLTNEQYQDALTKRSYLLLLDSHEEPANIKVLAAIPVNLGLSTEEGNTSGLNISNWQSTQQAAITWELSFTNVTEPTPQQGDNE